MNFLYALVALIVAFIGGLFYSKRVASQDAKVLDLTAKIEENKDTAKKERDNADKKTQEYLDAIKKYDPNFHSDDGDGQPSA